MASIRAAQAAGGPRLAGARGSPRRALPLREACGGAAGRGPSPLVPPTHRQAQQADPAVLRSWAGTKPSLSLPLTLTPTPTPTPTPTLTLTALLRIGAGVGRALLPLRVPCQLWRVVGSYVETSRPEASANAPPSTPRPRQIELGAASSLGQSANWQIP